MQSPITRTAGLLLTLALTGCDSGAGKTEPRAPAAPETEARTSAGSAPAAASTSTSAAAPAATQNGARRIALPSGLEYSVVKEGQGESPKFGSAVLIHCVGRLPGGREFWNTRASGVPQREILSHDQLIPGVVEALLAMKPGERRQLHVPSRLGYGDEGYPHVVPPRADLDMDLELVSVEP